MRTAYFSDQHMKSTWFPVSLVLLATSMAYAQLTVGYYARLQSAGTTYGDEFTIDASATPINEFRNHTYEDATRASLNTAGVHMGNSLIDLDVGGVAELITLGQPGQVGAGRDVYARVSDTLRFDNTEPLEVTFGIHSHLSAYADAAGPSRQGTSEFYIRMEVNPNLSGYRNFGQVFGDVRSEPVYTSAIGRTSDNLDEVTITLMPDDALHIYTTAYVYAHNYRQNINGVGEYGSGASLWLSLGITDVSDPEVGFTSELAQNYLMIPEPSTGSLLLGAVALSVVWARRRVHKA